MHELFVYYRVVAQHAAQALAIVTDWQRERCALHRGLSARLLKRPAESGAIEETWMETYADTLSPGGLGDALLAELAGGPSALADLVLGERHAEVFIACAS
jgi:hypothetical protein